MCTCTSHIGENNGDFTVAAGFKRVEFVDNGMRVMAPVRDVAPQLIPEHATVRTGVWCVVAVAAGTHARIVNETRGIDRWVHISTLCVPR
jgi:hypothetical protein